MSDTRLIEPEINSSAGSEEIERPYLQQNMTYRLVKAVNRLNRQAAAVVLGSVGLGLPEWRCLFLVALKGSLEVKELLELMHETKGLVSRSLSALEEKGLVRLTRHPNDKRQLLVAVTKQGMNVHRRALPAMEDRERRLISSINARDLAAIDRVIGNLHAALDDYETELADPSHKLQDV
jgi:DNA-binding MarR family transcriptional regulator